MAKNNKFNSGQAPQSLMARNLDELAEFESYKEEVLPKLRAAIKAGKSAKDLYKMVEAEAAARAITIGLTSQDEGKALAAVQDILNRVHGKAVEHKEIRAQFSELPDADLDSLIASELEDTAVAAKKH
jgi:hypothetical protein